MDGFFKPDFGSKERGCRECPGVVGFQLEMKRKSCSKSVTAWTAVCVPQCCHPGTILGRVSGGSLSHLISCRSL
jgi:hypothetical protein